LKDFTVAIGLMSLVPFPCLGRKIGLEYALRHHWTVILIAGLFEIYGQLGIPRICFLCLTRLRLDLRSSALHTKKVTQRK
jgi:hypothetical protein